MIILVLSRDKLSQNEFKVTIKDLPRYFTIGTSSNYSKATLNERIDLVKKSEQDTIIFHALKRSVFAVPKEWNPEPNADYQKVLFELADLIMYTPTLIQVSHGRELTCLKGKKEELKIIFDKNKITGSMI